MTEREVSGTERWLHLVCRSRVPRRSKRSAKAGRPLSSVGGRERATRADHDWEFSEPGFRKSALRHAVPEHLSLKPDTRNLTPQLNMESPAGQIHSAVPTKRTARLPRLLPHNEHDARSRRCDVQQVDFLRKHLQEELRLVPDRLK